MVLLFVKDFLWHEQNDDNKRFFHLRESAKTHMLSECRIYDSNSSRKATAEVALDKSVPRPNFCPQMQYVWIIFNLITVFTETIFLSLRKTWLGF